MAFVQDRMARPNTRVKGEPPCGGLTEGGLATVIGVKRRNYRWHPNLQQDGGHVGALANRAWGSRQKYLGLSEQLHSYRA